MIECFIPSKDRAAQLDLLLTSLSANAPNLFEVTVSYTYSNTEFARGYDLLRQRWPYVTFVYEDNPAGIFYDWLNHTDGPLISFFADDCIFYRKTQITDNDLYKLFTDPDLWTFTFRLGQNITIQDYCTNSSAERPSGFDIKGNILTWPYKQVRPDHSFGWPVGIDGYVWRKNQLQDLLAGEDFGNINWLEGLMLRKFREKPSNEWIVGCPLHSEVCVQQINVVHDRPHHTVRHFNVSLKELNDRFLAGETIDLSSMDFSGINCTHGEIPWSYND